VQHPRLVRAQALVQLFHGNLPFIIGFGGSAAIPRGSDAKRRLS
jgi:hypothetical protein